MPRFTAIPADQATGATAETYASIKKSVGKVPNAYAALASLAPAALQAMLAADKVLASGPLSKPDQETVKLVISELAGCDYCVAAHSMVGKLVGLSPDTLHAIRDGVTTGDARRDALVSFVRHLALNPGTLPESQVQALQAVGYQGEDIVHIGLAISVITFTNVFNRINDTVVDFPKPE
ncbi:carboxymuconolactone decarboxylase family protein [Pseudomonas sp. GD03842]|uniref:carboxymuconolactone decarboxylase family protein n=1 Tax=unclassified Pseudomonas TaxID=196821 RepID=UPI000D3C648D|nr:MULTISPECIES: carboxymuconolactone decarboxylase family protein [unclassified Pseudomonas]MDH0748890.1 carboxymuconolactone decarboxylase family protein [Pseudomonas sp. GD03842]RAU44116.1 carboxymuconolactone decarboxylase family protein [Pseudomonas sp. RIT 409]RAU54861.1 carboxymuconolactone decarboxylase family protein [Pseudomonas sp. RIT 412]